MRLHKDEGWKKVAEVVGPEVTAVKCKKRWLDVLQFRGSIEKMKWSLAEVCFDCIAVALAGQ